MCDHGHDHNSCCEHGDDIDETNSIAYSLYQKIDFLNLECLNESVDGAGSKVFKSWTERLSPADYVESDCDAELIFNIPFTGDVKLKGIVVIGDQELSRMKLFKSKMRMSFSGVDCEPDQEFEVTHDPQGQLSYPIKPSIFSNCHHLTIYFANRNKLDNSQPCRIFYIGLRGEFTQVNRDGIVIANYEIRPTEGIPEKLVGSTREVQ